MVFEYDVLCGSNVLILFGSFNLVDDDWLVWGCVVFVGFSILFGLCIVLLVGGLMLLVLWDEMVMVGVF